MALQDHLRGGFVDFRITPKGDTVVKALPYRIVAVYGILLLGTLLPVLILDRVVQAAGFYLLSALNGLFYATILWIAVIGHIYENGQLRSEYRWWHEMWPHLSTAGLGTALLVSAVTLRAPEAVHALTLSTWLNAVTRVEYLVSGAGSGDAAGTTRIRFSTPPLLWKIPGSL
jgi:cellulose synthase (UDP-forming)